MAAMKGIAKTNFEERSIVPGVPNDWHENNDWYGNRAQTGSREAEPGPGQSHNYIYQVTIRTALDQCARCCARANLTARRSRVPPGWNPRRCQPIAGTPCSLPDR